jgi:hypothetical protein
MEVLDNALTMSPEKQKFIGRLADIFRHKGPGSLTGINGRTPA